MRLLLLALLVCPVAWADVFGDYNQTNNWVMTTPDNSNYNPRSIWRIEFRTTGLVQHTSNQEIWRHNGTTDRCQIQANTLDLFCTVQSTNITLDLTGHTDIRVRVMVGLEYFSVEAWDGQGTTKIASDQNSLAPPYPQISKDYSGTWGLGGLASSNFVQGSGGLAFFRFYSTEVPFDYPPPRDPPVATADLADYRFENDATDDSPAALPALTGTLAFGSAPTYTNPASLATAPWSARAGSPQAIDGSWSFATILPISSYTWSHVSGPATTLIADTASATTTATFPVFGEYVIRLLVSDGTNQDQTDFTVGAVATSADGVVIQSDARADQMFGPMIAYDQSPWPWMDGRHRSLADYFGPTIMNDDWNDLLTGTISLTPGSPTVTGSGTVFQNDYCSGGTSPDANMRMVLKLSDGQNYEAEITTCDSATQITLNANFDIDAPSQSGIGHARWDDFGAWVGGGSNENNYDNVLAYYALYLRSGRTLYRTYARTLAGRWWEMPRINFGACNYHPGAGCVPNRDLSMSGVMWWAYESGRDIYIDVNASFDCFTNSSASQCTAGYNDWQEEALSTAGTWDIRDLGFILGFLAQAREFHTSSARRSEYNATLTTALTTGHRWVDFQFSNGRWASQSGFGGVEAGTVSVTNGSNVITCDSSCGDWEAEVDGRHMNVVPIGGNRWTRENSFEMLSATNNVSMTIDEPYDGLTESGLTYHIGGASNPYCCIKTQPFFMNLPMNALAWTWETTGVAAAKPMVVDAAKWLVGDAYRGFTVITNTYRPETGGVWYMRATDYCEERIVTSTTSCSNEGAPLSQQAIENSRFVSGELYGAFAWSYLFALESDPTVAHDVALLADQLVGHALGGPLGGPYSDGLWPAELGGNTLDKNKNFGFFWGQGAAWRWPAARLGGIPPEDPTTFYVPFDLSSVSNSVDVSVVLTEPKGFARPAVVCLLSPCAIVGDGRQGGHLATITYRDSGQSPLQTDETIAVPANRVPAGSRILPRRP